MAIKKINREEKGMASKKDSEIRLAMERNVKFLGEREEPYSKRGRGNNGRYLDGKSLYKKKDTGKKDIF